MMKSYLERTKSICNTILGSYLTDAIITFDDMLEYQNKLEKWLSTLNNCFITPPYFDRNEYVQCLHYIFKTKDAIYTKYFERYK